jgi:superfamily I DNA/RNA helicase
VCGLLRRDIEALKVGNEGLTRSFAIYDENDQQGIVKQVMRRMGLDTKQLTPRTVLGRISWAKNHMVDPQEYYLASKDPNSERVAHIYQGYRAELRKNNALDFDDLLLEAVRLLEGVERSSRTLPAPLSLPARGRVPGHQPPAVRADEAAGRGAEERLRRGRRGSEHLLLARRRYPQHP